MQIYISFLENHFLTFFFSFSFTEIEISTGVQAGRGGSLGFCLKEIGLSMPQQSSNSGNKVINYFGLDVDQENMGDETYTQKKINYLSRGLSNIIKKR